MDNRKKNIIPVSSKKGFSLIELMVAMFVFSIVMTATTGFFSSSALSYRNAREIQRNLEDAQFAMNLMAKSLRTSKILSCEGSPCSTVRVYDYSQDKCIEYSLKNNLIYIQKAPEGTTEEECEGEGYLMDPEEQMGATFVSSRSSFYVIPSSPTQVGKATISLEICSDAVCAKDKARIQSSVSLRSEYQEI